MKFHKCESILKLIIKCYNIDFFIAIIVKDFERCTNNHIFVVFI